MYNNGEPYKFEEKKKMTPYDSENGEFIRIHVNYDGLNGL